MKTKYPSNGSAQIFFRVAIQESFHIHKSFTNISSQFHWRFTEKIGPKCACISRIPATKVYE